MKRLKQAKDEAVVEIEAFKNEKEKQHKQLEHQVTAAFKFVCQFWNLINFVYDKILGNRSTNEDTIKIQTEKAIVEMTKAFEVNRATVLKHVLSMVSNITPKQHENLR